MQNLQLSNLLLSIKIVFLLTFMKVIMVSSMAQHTSTHYGKYTYPVWAEVLGWGIALVSVVWIPVGAIHEICNMKGSFLQVRTGLKCDG